jgi:thiosulfate dehydrogenase (quinone) large subunit
MMPSQNTAQNTARFATRESDALAAYFLLRVTLGLNICLHGVARLLAGSAKFAGQLAQQFHATPLPEPLVLAFAYALPWLEAAIGALVLIGLYSRLAFRAGALLMVVLTFGASLAQDWYPAGLQLIYALIYAILLAFSGWNRYSLDTWLHRTESKAA